MLRTLPLLLCAVACTADKAAAPRYALADMHGLDPEAAWVWRAGDTAPVDTAERAELDDEALIWARHDGEGGIELRQGSTWATGGAWGSLQFQTGSGDLVLTAWDLPTDSGAALQGTGRIRMADAEATHGDRHVSGDVTCETRIGDGVRTFFGTFDQTLTLACSGPSDRPIGRWVFARDVGLVQLRSEAVTSLDLVRPGW